MNLARRFKAWLHKVTAPEPIAYIDFVHEARDQLAEYGPNPEVIGLSADELTQWRDEIAARNCMFCRLYGRENCADHADDAYFGPAPGVVVATDMDGGKWTGGGRRKLTRAEHDEVFGHNRKR